MDPVLEIKARLPIEDLVGQYCQLQKKGRNFVCVCPFHNDKHPSFTVSPDKGIGYCFACSSGGDIFSFYQLIEGVDFRQAIKDLAEKTGVELPDIPQESSVKKDEKDRLRECLDAARKFYQDMLVKDKEAQEYLKGRSITGDQVVEFGIGVAPDSFNATYDHLLKEGFSRSEIVKAGLGVQKDLQEERIYDRFRHRIMFPIHDHQGKIVGFGGRTLGDSDAKYINSSEGPLYRKASVLYGYHYAKDAIRETKSVVMVEGYFDVLACNRCGIKNVVAVSGTALTEEHVKLLKRSADKLILCLDQDRAGRDAAERAFTLCSPEGLHVHAVRLEEKDPDELAAKDADALQSILAEGGKPYLDAVCEEIAETDLSSVEGKRDALERLSPLLQAIGTSVEREHYMGTVAALLGTTPLVLQEDLDRLAAAPVPTTPDTSPVEDTLPATSRFSKGDIALGLFCMYPAQLHLLDQFIEPEEGLQAVLYASLKKLEDVEKITVEMLSLPEEYAEKLSILLLFCEQNNFGDWSESLAAQEIRRNMQAANREFLQQKQREIAKKLVKARAEGNSSEEVELSTQYQRVLKLAKMAR